MFEAEEFGRKVASTRARLGLKPKELAAKMGVNPATVYRIERGQRADISRPQLEALARALETSEDALLASDVADAKSPDEGDLGALILERVEALDQRLDRIEVDLASLRDELRDPPPGSAASPPSRASRDQAARAS